MIAEEGLNHGLKVKTNVGKYIKISRPAALQKQHTNTSRGAVLGGKNVDLIVFLGHFFLDGMTLLSLSGIYKI